MLRATFGLLVSQDAGATWGWICESALGFNGTEDPAVAVTADGTILAALYEGMATSNDTGCSWAFAPSLAGWVSADVAVRPEAPDDAVALAWIEDTTDAGLTTFETHVFETSDDGVDWSQAGSAIDPTALLQTIDVAASDPNRIYVCGVHGIYETQDVTLYTSRDGGQTFVENAVPVDTELESNAYIAAVDPVNADRLYVRTWPISRLLVSDDAGQSFRAVLTFAGEMQGFAASPDGTTLYAGGPTDGLWVGDATTLSFRQVSSVPIQCLATSGATLYACSNDPPFALGASADGGASFTPLLRFAAIPGALSCPSSSQTASCSGQFPAICETLPGCGEGGAGNGAEADGGPRGAGSSSRGSLTAETGEPSCGCHAVGFARRTRRRLMGSALALSGFSLMGAAFRRLFRRKRPGDPYGRRKPPSRKR